MRQTREVLTEAMGELTPAVNRLLSVGAQLVLLIPILEFGRSLVHLGNDRAINVLALCAAVYSLARGIFFPTGQGKKGVWDAISACAMKLAEGQSEPLKADVPPLPSGKRVRVVVRKRKK